MGYLYDAFHHAKEEMMRDFKREKLEWNLS
jgi:hypothetical protein